MRPKYSIITIVCNGTMKHTARCIESIYESTKDFELIVVDSNTTDAHRGYLNGIGETHSNLKVILSDKNMSFAENNNLGIQVAEGDYVIFLNNDTIVSKDWIERMVPFFSMTPFQNVGAVGPVSSMSNGRQMVGQQDPEKWHQDHRGHWKHTGVLYGWCIMVKKSVLDEVGGFDERFENAYEDNDLSLRIQLAGYTLIIAFDTYIYHLGQGTLKTVIDGETYMKKGMENREKYFDKWHDPSQKKLVAVYRTNWGEHLEESLEQTSKFADSIIIHFCRAPKVITKWKGRESGIIGTDLIETTMPIDLSRDEAVDWMKKKFPKIVHVEFYDGIFQEDYERGRLLELALELNAKGEADWCISIDDDEIYEDKFIDRMQKMMHPRNPETLAYWCNWRTIWDKRCGVEYYRTDSTFGSFSNYRFFRLIKGQKIVSFHPEGHHCGSAPWFADENLRWTNIRVKHLGYDTPEQRQKKFEFYERNDNFKSKRDIGNDDYSHLISKNPQVEVYRHDNGISLLMMIGNEEISILGALENFEPLVDEMVIVNTGSNDKTMDIVNCFAKFSSVPVKVYDYKWEDNFSTPRNFGKFLCTQPWILMMDADERFQPQDIVHVFKASETDSDVVLFNVANYMTKEKPGEPAVVAPTQSSRLYRNIPEFYYTGIVHETIDDSVVALKRRRKIKGMLSSVILHHYGYISTDKSSLRQKFDFYEKLNLRQIEITEGLDPRPYFNLALHYINDGKETEALMNFQMALKIDPKFYHASQQMFALNLQNAKVFLGDTLKFMPESHPARGQFIELYKMISEKSKGFVKVC